MSSNQPPCPDVLKRIALLVHDDYCGRWRSSLALYCYRIYIEDVARAGVLSRAGDYRGRWVSTSTRRGCYEVFVRALAEGGSLPAAVEIGLPLYWFDGPQPREWQRLEIARTPCGFGGSRPWFLCACGRRARIIYQRGPDDFGRPERFGFRVCVGLQYPSRLRGRYPDYPWLGVSRRVLAAYVWLEKRGLL